MILEFTIWAHAHVKCNCCRPYEVFLGATPDVLGSLRDECVSRACHACDMLSREFASQAFKGKRALCMGYEQRDLGKYKSRSKRAVL